MSFLVLALASALDGSGLITPILDEFAGTYKSIGQCKMIDGNRTIDSLSIAPAFQNSRLPSGSLTLTFQEPEPWHLYYFSVHIAPGTGQSPIAYSEESDTAVFQYESHTEPGYLSSKNHFYNSFNDSYTTKIFNLKVDDDNPAIYQLEYSTGYYDELDTCLLVKTSQL